MMAVLWFAQCIGSDIANAHYWCSAWRVSFSYSEWRMSEIINMRGVSKSFVHGKVETFALRDFELRISEGELVAITAPSGAGKSSFMSAATVLSVGSTMSISRWCVRIPNWSRDVLFTCGERSTS